VNKEIFDEMTLGGSFSEMELRRFVEYAVDIDENVDVGDEVNSIMTKVGLNPGQTYSSLEMSAIAETLQEL